MGNRAIITFENHHSKQHPVALYVHWNGGLESVLAFVSYTWDTFERGHGDMYTFHARLCQVLGNFFPDGLSFYGIPLRDVHKWVDGCDNGRFHFRVGEHEITLPGRDTECASARVHAYWTNPHSIFDSIRQAMPTKGADYSAVGGVWNTQGEAVA
ncbi:MAG: hypothetical protein ABL907_00420 [Hyphomicrobium sp.]